MITLATTTAGARRRTREHVNWWLHATIVGGCTVAGVARFGVGAAIFVVVAIGAVAAVVDARTGRIPNRLVAMAAVAVAVAVLTSIVVDGPGAAPWSTLVGAIAFAGPLLVCHLVAPDSIGFGDVKLAAVAGAALGLVDGRLGLLALCISTGATAIAGVVGRRSTLPLGPGLMLGTAVAALTAPIIGWTWS